MTAKRERPVPPTNSEVRARERFRNERSAYHGAHILEHDPEDDFGGDTSPAVPDLWKLLEKQS